MWSSSLLALILALAPVVRGGNRPVALLVLETLSVLLLTLTLADRGHLRAVPRAPLVLLVLLLALPGLYLIPIPFDLWRELPGRGHYASAMAIALGGAHVSHMPATLDAESTWYSWLALLCPAAVFLAVVAAPRERCRGLANLFLGVAALEALLGLVQFGQGPSSILRLGWEAGGNAIGTYANRDHLAGLLEMALPMAIALWVASLGRGVTDARSGGWRARLLRVEGRSLLYGFLALLILVGLIFTQSRTGVALSILLVFLTTILFSFKLGGSNAYGLVGSLFVVGLSVAVMIGLVPVLERFTTDPMHDARWGIYAATWTAIKVFFPLGSGVGTYAEVFQRFQTADLSGMFVNNAHDDYLEWLMEGGAAAAALVVAFLGLYLVRWFSVYTRGTWRTHNFIQVAAGLGVLAMAMHSLVDFNLHIPANQIYLALLAGLFFRVNAEDVSGHDMGRRSAGS